MAVMVMLKRSTGLLTEVKRENPNVCADIKDIVIRGECYSKRITFELARRLNVGDSTRLAIGHVPERCFTSTHCSDRTALQGKGCILGICLPERLLQPRDRVPDCAGKTIPSQDVR